MKTEKEIKNELKRLDDSGDESDWAHDRKIGLIRVLNLKLDENKIKEWIKDYEKSEIKVDKITYDTYLEAYKWCLDED